MMVVPPVAGVIVVETVGLAHLGRNSLGKLTQDFLRNAQRRTHHQKFIPQDQIAGDSFLEAREVLEPMLERLAAGSHLGTLRRKAAKRKAQANTHQHDGHRDNRGDNVRLRAVGKEDGSHGNKGNQNTKNQAKHHCDNAVRGNVLAIGQLALNGVLIVLEFVAHGCGVLLDVVPQLVKRARAITVLVGLSAGKEDLEHRAVNALGRLPTRITHRHAIRLLFFFTPQQTLLGLGHSRLLQLDHTVVSELHERGDICLIGHLVPVHEGRKHGGMVGRRHIAEIFVLEKRLGLAAAQLEHNDCAGKGHRRDNAHHGKHVGNHARAGAAGVSFVGPRLLLAQDCRHVLLA